MAEQIEEPELESSEAGPPGPVGVAAAVAAAVGRRKDGGEGEDGLDAFLREQARLTRLQSEHLHEQREVVLSRLRWGRLSDRLKALLQLMTAGVGVTGVIGIAAMAWAASQQRALVVEPFSAPPSFVQSGFSGQVIAGDVKDRLAAIRRVVTLSFSGSREVRADSQDVVKVEIPETGVSVAELWRGLRDWLGSDRKVEGSLRALPDGSVVLRAAMTGADPVEARGQPRQLEQLEQQVAEGLLAQADPENWANYLAWTGRRTEALAAMARLPSLEPDSSGRANAFSLWSNHTRDPIRSRELYRTALAIDPKLATPWYEKARVEHRLGHDEASLAAARRLLTTRDANQAPGIRGQGFRIVRADALMAIAQATGDFAGATARRDPADPTNSLPFEAADARGLHDGAGARTILTQYAAFGTGEAALLSVRADADAAADAWAAAAGDTAQLIAAEDDARAASTDVDEQAGIAWTELVRDRPRLAEARARLGDIAGATAAIAPTPLDCYPCLRERGRIAAAARDWAQADRWFGEAVRQGPSLPFAYAEWGEMLLARGDSAGAIAKLRAARQKGPHWADPLELWGEALMRQGAYDGAASKFREADKGAPKWGRNHLMWGEALMLAGRYREARAQFEATRGLDLASPDRAALAVLLSRTASGRLHG